MLWRRMAQSAARRALALRLRVAGHQRHACGGRAALRTLCVAGLATGCLQMGPRDDAPRKSAAPSAVERDDEAPGPAGLGVAIAGRVCQAARGVRQAVERRAETEEGRTLLRLIAANVAVYAAWKVAPATFMVRHFASSLEAMRRGRVWVTVTANFSHQGALHLAANMFLLDMFGRDVISVLTPERFTVLYVAGGIASVLGSLVTRRLLRNNVLSLGASGSVMATMFMFANLFPDRKLYLFGVWEVKARDALVLWALVDTAGLLGSFGKIDFAAHISGGLFSLAYYKMIREDLAREYQARQRATWRLFGYSTAED
jgi:membrane associated rhomboid family serine protease